MVSECRADTSSALGYFSSSSAEARIRPIPIPVLLLTSPTPSSKWYQVPSDSLPRVFNLRQVASPIRAAVSLVRENASSLKRSSVPQVRQSSASLPGLQLDANARVAHGNLKAEWSLLYIDVGLRSALHAQNYTCKI